MELVANGSGLAGQPGIRRSDSRSYTCVRRVFFFFFQAEDGIRDYKVTGVQTCALPISQRVRWDGRDRAEGRGPRGGAVPARAHHRRPRPQPGRGGNAGVRAAADLAREPVGGGPGAGWHSRRLSEIFSRIGGRRRPHRRLRARPGATVSDQVHQRLQGLPEGRPRPEGRLLSHREGRVRVSDRPLGRREVHGVEAGVRRGAPHERRGARLRLQRLRPPHARDPDAAAAAGDRVPGLPPARRPHGRRERRVRARGDGSAARHDSGARDARPHAGGPRRESAGVPARAVGRRATAGGDRARPRERAHRAARRRADREPRRTRDARRLPAAPRHQRERHGRGDGNARPRPRAAGTLPRHRAAGRGGGVRLGGRRGAQAGGPHDVNLTIREALLAFRRAPLLSALSVTTIAFSLFVLGLFGLVAVDFPPPLDEVAPRVGIVAFPLPGTPGETVTLALKDIEAFPQVQAAEDVSEDSALGRAKRELVEFRDVLRELERNPLPASIEVKLKPGFRDADHVAAVAERMSGFGFVDDVRFGREWVENVDRLRGLAAAVGLVVGAAFAVVAIIIIGTTIRMAVLQRSREIAIMRLVGATDGFVRRPFLLQGAIKGLLGGAVALGLSFVAYLLINRYLLQSSFFTQEEALAIVAFGALIGLLGSATSVGRHLKRV